MRHHLLVLSVLLLAGTLSTACDLFNRDNNPSPTPTTPTPTVSMEVFAGTWASSTASTPATGCGTVRYTVTPLTATTGAVTFSATCAGNIQVSGTGNGQLNGSALEWAAQGLVVQGGVNCPFTFTNSRATQDASNIRVQYSGTVCGIPVSGTEVVRR
jgi:hypothetical protein